MSPPLSLKLAFLPPLAADLDLDRELDLDAERRRALSADRDLDSERDWDGERLEDAVALAMVLSSFLGLEAR